MLYNATSASVGGGLSYAVAQLGALQRNLGKGQITALVTPLSVEAISTVPGITVRLIRSRSVAQRVLWEQLVMPVMSRRFDVVVCAGNIGMIWSPRPQVVILQNPNYIGYGRRLPQNQRVRLYLEIGLSWLSMRRAESVVVISNSMMNEVKSESFLRRANFRVILSGSPNEIPADEEVDEDQDLRHTPFVLSVANYYAHKRLEDIAVAFSRTAQSGRLVFVGSIPNDKQRRIGELAGARMSDLRFLGAISSPARVASLYRKANLALSVSELEAFPLTPHEAGSHGCPLLLSDIAPHREIAGDYAHYVPVGDIVTLSLALDDALSRPRGQAYWAWPFSWDEHGRELVDLLERLPDGLTSKR